MNKMTKVASLAVAMAFSGVSNAAIGDYKVVLIHGFQPDQLQTQPSRTQVETEGADYWKDYWMQYADARIDWPSQERVEGKITSDYVCTEASRVVEKWDMPAGLYLSDPLYR